MGQGIPTLIRNPFPHGFSTEPKEAVHCGDGCSALQGRMQCIAGAVAVHCGSGCSALRLRWVKLVPKSPVLFWIREKG